jgi:four helix bundle protein
MTVFRHFSEIQAWQEARQLAKEVFELTSQHQIGDAPFRDQMRRAAVSVMANIAEGFGRGTDPQFLKFLDIARGSAAETEALLILAEDLDPDVSRKTDAMRRRLSLCVSMIAKLTTYLRAGRAEASNVVYSVEHEHPSNHGTSGLPDFRTSGRLS